MRMLMPGMVALLCACGTTSEPPQPNPDPTPAPVRPAPSPAPTHATAEASPATACEATITAAAKRIASESQRVALDTMIERTAAVMIASCETEQWPANVMTCIAAARLDADLDACTEELTYRQHKRLHDKIAAVTPKKPPIAKPTSIAVRGDADDLITPGSLAPDCSKTVVNARDMGCIRQYCKAHPHEARCMIE